MTLRIKRFLSDQFVFARARLRWFSSQLPKSMEQQVMFDIRGIALGDRGREQIRQRLSEDAALIRFKSE